MREHVRRMRFGPVLAALAMAVAIMLLTGVGAFAIVAWLFGDREAADSVPAFVQSFGAFAGFVAGGMYTARRAHHDRMLHAVVLIALGFAAMALFTTLDLALGLSVESLMPGGDLTDAAQVHIGFWIVNWVAVIAGATLGAAIVPRRGETWGTTYAEPEDTEL